MEDYIILVKKSNGTVSVVYPTGDVASSVLTATIVRESDSMSYSIVSRADFKAMQPADRRFRDAWELIEGRLVETTVKMKEIIRQARNRALERLDQMAIVEARKPNRDVAAIDRKAQNMRNIPERLSFREPQGRNDLVDLLNEIEDI